VTSLVKALGLAATLVLVVGCAPVWKEGRATPPGEEATRSVTFEVEPLRQAGRFWQVRLTGSVSSDDPLCVESQEIVVESRGSGTARWGALGSELTDEAGSYSLKLDVHRDEELRVVVPRYEYCNEVVSSIRKIGG
jgi:hypothetical protein